MSGAEFLGEATVTGKLYVPGLPCYKRADSGTVHGELYRVSDSLLERLDYFEGYRKSNPNTSFYNRVTVEAIVGGSKHSAEIYEYNGGVDEEDLREDGTY